MFDIDLWKEIILSLRKNKSRSALTAFGVFWGIFMLVVMAGAGNGLKTGMTNGISSIATNSFFMWTNQTSEPFAGFRRGRSFSFTNDDVDYIRLNVPEAEDVAPMIFGGGGNNTMYNNKFGSYNIKGMYPEYQKIDKLNIIDGRWLNQVDVLDRRKVCVVGEEVVEELFETDEEAIGTYIKVNGMYYQVVGIANQQSNMNINGRASQSIFIPFTTMQLAYNYGTDVHLLAITSKKGVEASFVEEKVIKALKHRHKIAPNDKQAISHINLEKQFKMFANLFLGIDILTWIVGIGTLLAGVIGVSNIMLVTIKERTQEIGVMRALGATPAKVVTQIISESIFLTAVAGYLGMFLGILLLEGVSAIINMVNSSNSGNDVFFQDPSISLGVALSCLTILIISGAFAGYIPAKKAVKIKPIDALRTE